MTIAELHGKISPTGVKLHNQLEDLLTSDVFSACKYTRPESLLLPFLNTARSLEGESLARFMPATVAAAQFRFWPMLKRSEPDLLIALKLEMGKSILVMIEAKYLSLKSSPAVEADQLEIAQAPGDQLAREHLDLLEAHELFHLGNSEIASRFLVYVTANRRTPEAELRESMDEIARFLPAGTQGDIYWTNWFTLQPILEKREGLLAWEKPILEDLRRLLERKRLISFRGFRKLNPVQPIQKGAVYRGKRSGPAVDKTIKGPFGS